MGVKFSHKQLRTYIDMEPGLHADPLNAKKLDFHVVLDVPPPGFTGFATDESVIRMLTEDMFEEIANCLLRGGWPKVDDPSHKYYVVAFWLQDVSSQASSLSFGRVLVAGWLAESRRPLPQVLRCCILAS